MALADRAIVTTNEPFLQRLQMAVAATSLGLALNIVPLPQGTNVTLTQCGKLTDAVLTNSIKYLNGFASGVVNFPSIAAIIDGQPGTDPDTLGASIADDLILEATSVVFLSFAAGF